MRLFPIQLWDATLPADWVLAYGQATDVLAALIGIFIAYQAYRGYRRNQSRPMLYISIGFVLALAVPFVMLLVYILVPVAPESFVSLISQTSQVLGLLSILYAIRMPT